MCSYYYNPTTCLGRACSRHLWDADWLTLGNNLRSTKNLQTGINPEVESIFNNYPDSVRKKTLNLRKLIIEAANKIEEITDLEETLKWGEPSYLTKNGSTIRIDWKSKTPNQYAMYFKCTSKLVPTFKMVFGDLFKYEKDRAILFDLDEKIQKKELKVCITAALTYHTVKQLPALGI
jgi:hypothetical protein